MSKARIIWLIMLALVGLIVARNGVKEFDSAVSWLQAFRGLFWLAVGIVAFHNALQDWSRHE